MGIAIDGWLTVIEPADVTTLTAGTPSVKDTSEEFGADRACTEPSGSATEVKSIVRHDPSVALKRTGDDATASVSVPSAFWYTSNVGVVYFGITLE
jgi:hypothetical protein